MSSSDQSSKAALLMNAKWDSDVGYAWWLMESYWALLANTFCGEVRPILVYPSISRVPEVVENSELEVIKADFAHFGWRYINFQLQFIRAHRVRYLYLTDSPVRHWTYLLFRLSGVKRIAVHDHTPGARTAPKGLKRLAKIVAARIPFINADVLIGATDFVRQRFIDVVCAPPEKCRTAPNGIAPRTADSGDVYKEFQLAPDTPIIVTIARANEYKGVRFALETLATLKQSHPDLRWHYLFMGDGPHREDFIELASQHGLAEVVSFPGKVEGAAGLLNNCAVAFHPSKGEVGYCLAILEYMQAGLPTVVPDNPSVCEATLDGITGRVYEEASAESAANALAEYLLNPTQRARQGKSAQEAIKQHYALAHSHEALVQIIRNHLIGLK
jgi:glycosyltransferase involved in cell wall biosynthesis